MKVDFPLFDMQKKLELSDLNCFEDKKMTISKSGSNQMR